MDLIITSVFIGIGLAMDCLAVSFAVGAHQKTSRLRAAIILALFFGGFQGGMTLLGWLAGTGFADTIAAFDHWVAAGLLFIIGGKMIFDGIKDGLEEEAPDVFNLVIVLILAVATSIDALAVGAAFIPLHCTTHSCSHYRPDICIIFHRRDLFGWKGRVRTWKAC